jgi:hypothetical protein
MSIALTLAGLLAYLLTAYGRRNAPTPHQAVESAPKVVSRLVAGAPWKTIPDAADDVQDILVDLARQAPLGHSAARASRD